MNNYYEYLALCYPPYLAHHGIKGQKWGIRRFQNPDGSLTKEGRIRYANLSGSARIRYHIGNAKSTASKAYDKAKAVGSKVASGAKKVGSKIGGAVVKSIKKRHPSLMTDDELRDAVNRVSQEKKYNDMIREMKSQKLGSKLAAATGHIAEESVLKFATSFAQSAGNQLAKNIMKNELEKQKDRTALVREREAEQIARANETQRNDEVSNMNDSTNLTRTRQSIRNAESRRDSLSSDDVRRLAYDRNIASLRNRERNLEQRISEREERMNLRRQRMESQGYTVYGTNNPQQNNNNGKKKKKKKKPPND